MSTLQRGAFANFTCIVAIMSTDMKKPLGKAQVGDNMVTLLKARMVVVIEHDEQGMDNILQALRDELAADSTGISSWQVTLEKHGGIRLDE